MSGRSRLRVVTAGVLALALALGGPAAMSFADETDPTTTPTSTEVVEPTTTTEPAPTTTEPSPTVPAEPTTPTPNEPVTIEPVPTPTGPWGGPAPVEIPPPGETNQPAAAQADLKVTVGFKQAEYLPGVGLDATVTVENVGDAAVESLQSNYSGSVWLTSGYQELQALSGIRFEPGQKKVIEVVGRLHDARASVASFTVQAFQHHVADPTPHDNQATATTTVVQKRGSFSGTAYSDGNGNSRLDDGEGVAGVEVHTYGGLPYSNYSAVTDEAGRFAFTDVPTGKHYVYFIGGGGVVVKPGSSEFVVEEGKNTDLELAAVRPVSDVLDVTLELDRDSYGKDDHVNVKITLTNTGADPLSGVVATCNHSGESSVLTGTGPGWAPLAVDGPGTSLAAGETKTLVIPDVVPEEAYNRGQLGAECNFGNNGSQELGYVGGSDFAEVVGATGSATGLVVHDKNNDNKYDGDGLPDVKLVALHPKTRAVVARAVTDASGYWTFTNLPVGSVPVVVLGPWKDRYSVGNEHAIQVVGNWESRSLFSVVPGPEVLDPAPLPAELEVSATLDKTSFYSGEVVKATVTIKNTGGTASQVVRAGASGGTGFSIDYDSWGDLSFNKPGVVIQPGGVHVAHVTGRAASYTTPSDRLIFKGQLYTMPDNNWANNFFEASAAITHVHGSAAFTVYSDANGNDQVDVGEGIGGVRVHMFGPRWGTGAHDYDVITGADGKAVVADLPTGAYSATYASDAGWLVPFDHTLEVQPDKRLEVVRKAKRPLSDTLQASIQFDQDTYAPGDTTVNLTVTLTNSGVAIPTVQTLCTGSGEPFELYNFSGDGWGPLKYGGPGFSLASGETKIFHVSAPLPAGAPAHGFVTVNCLFGSELGSDEGSPMAGARANIPGLTSDAVGRVLHDHDNNWQTEGQPVANTKIVLLDADTGKWAVSAVTDSTGKYEFKNVPVGNYTPLVVGPWKFAEGRDTRIRVIHGQAYPHDLWVVPGPEVADPEPVAPAPGQAPPAAQGGGAAPVTKNPLATTGAGVAGLSVLGIGLLLAGAGSLTAVRRRHGVAV